MEHIAVFSSYPTTHRVIFPPAPRPYCMQATALAIAVILQRELICRKTTIRAGVMRQAVARQLTRQTLSDATN